MDRPQPRIVVPGQPLVATVTIGQTTRPDLLEPVLAVLPDGVGLIEVGALDGLTRGSIAVAGSDAISPLTTRLADGSPIVVDEGWLGPHVQAAVDLATGLGARAILLLCAGGFGSVRSKVPLIRPAQEALKDLLADGAPSVLVVVPAAAQVAASEAKWRASGISPRMLAAPIDQPTTILAAATDAAAVVLDYVGHPRPAIDRLEAALASAGGARLLDLGRCGARALAEAVAAATAADAAAPAAVSR